MIAHFWLHLQRLGNQVEKACVLDKLTVRIDHFFRVRLLYLLHQVQVVVARFLVSGWVQLTHGRVSDQTELVRQVAVEMSQLCDEEDWEFGLAQHVVFYLGVQHALLQHQQQSFTQ